MRKALNCVLKRDAGSDLDKIRLDFRISFAHSAKQVTRNQVEPHNHNTRAVREVLCLTKRTQDVCNFSLWLIKFRPTTLYFDILIVIDCLGFDLIS